MKNILWVIVFLSLFINNGYSQILVVDTAFVKDTQPLIFSNITLGRVETYAAILDSFPLAEKLVKDNIDTCFYIRRVGDYYMSQIGIVESKFEIIKRYPGYLELYAHGKTDITLIVFSVPAEARALIKYDYQQESDSTVQNRIEIYFESKNVLLLLADFIGGVVEETAKKLMEYIRIIGEKVYKEKLMK